MHSERLLTELPTWIKLINFICGHLIKRESGWNIILFFIDEL